MLKVEDLLLPEIGAGKKKQVPFLNGVIYDISTPCFFCCMTARQHHIFVGYGKPNEQLNVFTCLDSTCCRKAVTYAIHKGFSGRKEVIDI